MTIESEIAELGRFIATCNTEIVTIDEELLPHLMAEREVRMALALTYRTAEAQGRRVLLGYAGDVVEVGSIRFCGSTPPGATEPVGRYEAVTKRVRIPVGREQRAELYEHLTDIVEVCGPLRSRRRYLAAEMAAAERVIEVLRNPPKRRPEQRPQMSLFGV